MADHESDQLTRHFRRIVERLLGTPNQKLSTRDQFRYGSNGSLAVEVGGDEVGKWYDHEQGRGGGIVEFMWIYGDVKPEDIAKWMKEQLGIDLTGGKKDDQTYAYVDERGNLLFHVHRFYKDGKKVFWQSQPGPDKGGIKRNAKGKPTMEGARYVPYHLDELVKARAQGLQSSPDGQPWRVYIAEGEKCVDRLRGIWGVIATCNPGGAGKWRAEYSTYLAGADAVLLADNDDSGRDHMQAVAQSLEGIAASIRIIVFADGPAKGDIYDWIEAGGSQSDLETLIEEAPLYGDEDETPLAPQGQPEIIVFGNLQRPIAARQWLLGTTFCRGFLSGLTGSGAAGKTALRIAQLIALALGRGELVGEHVFQRVKVLLVCLEDDEEELRRRVRAACLHHNIDEAELNGWLYAWTPRNLRLLEVDRKGNCEPGQLGDALRRIIRKLGIGLICIDPFIKSHGANENDNVQIDRAASLLLQIGHDLGCAVDYVHHHRKGLSIAGDAESGRGAKSLADASRLVKTVTTMTPVEAARFGIDEDQARAYVRLDSAKVNIAPAGAAVWFKLASVAIGNAEPNYPQGDHVQAAERWHPPRHDDKVTKAHLAAIVEAVRQGPGEESEFYSHDPRSNGCYLGNVVIEQIPDLSDYEVSQLIADWIKNGVLRVDRYLAKKTRKWRPRVQVNETKAAEILGSLYRSPLGF